ncbi:response regulator [Thermithiobacillus tepidarius DSM 3134]|uniref:response regulator transcription factor n=1 Tax=Thermithiobacillus tepidarius TaxID=929 RepID=UPI0003FEB43F|nr:response regulator [Thermithiobacillus tepidarius]
MKEQPAMRRPGTPARPSASTPTHPAVLVVEDDAQAAKLLAMYLDAAGYGSVLVRSGEEALQQAARLRPQAIFLDLLLPGMDGWDVLTALKASPRTRDIPVVIISVLDRQALGFRLGAVDYLVKPVDRMQLLRALGRCLRQRGTPGVRQQVMVVDDDADALRLLSAYLANAGFDVVQALGGAEGIYLAKLLRPALVVVDLLSGTDCLSVIPALHGDPGAHIPVLVLTTSQLVQAQQALGYGEIHIITVRQEGVGQELLTAIAQVLPVHGQP